jgi:MFS transporter, BCD family, chlorophyll transporter
MSKPQITSWLTIVRLGVVQMALGSVVVLTTSTMNRVMVVELALPAMLPGVLVALHYFVQMLRPRLGHGSDVGGRRSNWIIGGMALLAIGGIAAALATAWMSSHIYAGIALAVVAFLLIGIGVGAAGTSLLVLVAKQVAAERRAQTATIMWTMMIAGFVITTGFAGHFLDPYSSAKLVMVTTVTALIAFVAATAAVWDVEPHTSQLEATVLQLRQSERKQDFRASVLTVWRESQARRFTIFVFVSMLAYSAQDLILEPFAGLVFAMTPGQSTQLSAMQNAGVLVGMILVALSAQAAQRWLAIALREWTIGGCVFSAFGLLGVAWAGSLGDVVFLKAAVLALGFGNGVFAVAAIGRMMDLAAVGAPGREGVRMGLWGAAQAVAFGLGGVIGAMGVDVARSVLASPLLAYGMVFVAEALLFLMAARLAYRVGNKAVVSRDYEPRPLAQLVRD